MKTLEELIQIRRFFHQNPELGYQEHNTQKYIVNYFNNKNCQIYKIKTSTLVFFDNNKEETIAFRSEEDALPILETNEIIYKSKNKNMHACGHDGHLAMLIKLGDYINQHIKALRYNYFLIFESGEELSGSVKDIIESDVFNNHIPKYIFALHLYPFNKEEGIIFTGKKDFLAKSTEINIEVFGKSSHVVKKEEGIDAIKIMNKLYVKINNYLSSINDIRFLFGKISGGSQRNVVADYSFLQGTIRSFSDSLLEQIKNKINHIASQYKGLVSITYNDIFDGIYNDENLIDKISECHMIKLTEKLFIGETFGSYQKKSKINYSLLSINGNVLHSSNFDFNEKVLLNGLEYFKSLLNID